VSTILSAVKLVNKYSGRFNELEERIDILYRNLEKRINRLLVDLINEVKDAVGYALEIGGQNIDLKTRLLPSRKSVISSIRELKQF